VEIYCYSLWGNDIFPTMQTFPTMPITNVRLSTQCTVYKRPHTHTHTHTHRGKFIFCPCITLDRKKVQSVNTGCYVSHVCASSIFLYAVDILLLAPSASSLQKLLSACEEELCFLYLRINDKKVGLYTFW